MNGIGRMPYFAAWASKVSTSTFAMLAASAGVR